MDEPTERFVLDMVKHTYQMNSVLLFLLAEESPERARQFLRTLEVLLDETREPAIDPGLLEAAGDVYDRLAVLLKQPNPPATSAGNRRTRPAWLQGVFDGGTPKK